MNELEVVIKTIENKEHVTKKFNFKGNLHIPVTTLLEKINRSYDIKVNYSSSCLQGLCGSCAMLINGWPKLACKTFVDEEVSTKYFHKITLEPLSKFPIIKDLKVDRSVIHENLKKTRQWIECDAQINEDNINFEYDVSQCLMCGCCLETCPNYNGEDDYYGVVLAVSSSKLVKQETDKEKLKQFNNDYNNHFFKDCVKSLVCEDVCPMKIPTQRAISIMNRQSIWKFRHLFSK